MRRGLRQVISQNLLSLLSPTFLHLHMKGAKSIDLRQLSKLVVYSGGYSPHHRVVKLFWHLLQELSLEQLRKLLLFWTGTSVSPTFSELRSSDDQLTISRKGEDEGRGAKRNGLRLPEAQTCDKHLYLPQYESLAEVS